jgi:protein O-GlcNAc transferase
MPRACNRIECRTGSCRKADRAHNKAFVGVRHATAVVVFVLTALLPGFAIAAGRVAQAAAAQTGRNAEIQAAYQAGAAAAAKSDYRTAETQFEKVVQLAPQIPEGHLALGAVLIRLAKFPQAIQELERALTLKPGDVSAQSDLAWAYQQTGAHQKALALFEKIEAEAAAKPASDPAHTLPPSVLLAYAQSLAATGQVSLAIGKMKTAVAKSPQSADLHDALGSLYAQERNWPAATGEFREAVRLSPQLGSAHMHLGAALLAEGQPQPAIQELTVANQLIPHSAPAITELGKAFAANQENDKAIAEFQRALSIEPGYTDARLQLALAMQRAGDDSDAIPLLRQAVQVDPKNSEAASSLGLALLITGNAKDAIPYLERTLKQKPRDPIAHENLAAAYLQMNEVDEAIRVLSSGLKKNPDDFQLHYNLGLALKLKDDSAAAIPELEAAARLNTSAHEPHYTLGILYMEDGRYEEAARELTLAMKLHPANGDGWATLGSVYRKMNKLPEAADALREAIRQMPDQPDPHLTLASVLAEEGDAAGAAAERRKGADLERVAMKRQRATMSTNSGNSLLQKGQVADAIERYQQALNDDPDYADAHRGLAKALDRQGKKAEAEAERQKAEELEKSRQ